jgi:nitrite reductase/ring-hydroxylating ferredoxin subunit
MGWQPTGISDALLRPGEMREILVGSRSVVLVRLGDGVYALEGTCPHSGGLLVDGTLRDGRLQCPVHGAVFDARTGAVRADPDGIEPPQGGVEALQRFPTRVNQGMIEVDDLPVSSGPSPPGVRS